jgi:hypothetical protein
MPAEQRQGHATRPSFERAALGHVEHLGELREALDIGEQRCPGRSVIGEGAAQLRTWASSTTAAVMREHLGELATTAR